MVVIKVKDICSYAVFEQDGIKLREAILREMAQGNDITLDFEGIDLFATMFFNASIGWIVLRDGPEVIEHNVSYTNLTELGQSTWEHSFQNAINVRNDPDYQEALKHYAEDESEDE